MGLAKSASVAGEEITFDVFFEHFGNSTATNLSALDDLDAAFGAGNYMLDSITLVSGPATFAANGAFTGSGANTELVGAGSTLGPRGDGPHPVRRDGGERHGRGARPSGCTKTR